MALCTSSPDCTILVFNVLALFLTALDINTIRWMIWIEKREYVVLVLCITGYLHTCDRYFVNNCRHIAIDLFVLYADSASTPQMELILEHGGATNAGLCLQMFQCLQCIYAICRASLSRTLWFDQASVASGHVVGDFRVQVQAHLLKRVILQDTKWSADLQGQGRMSF